MASSSPSPHYSGGFYPCLCVRISNIGGGGCGNGERRHRDGGVRSVNKESMRSDWTWCSFDRPEMANCTNAAHAPPTDRPTDLFVVHSASVRPSVRLLLLLLLLPLFVQSVASFSAYPHSSFDSSIASCFPLIFHDWFMFLVFLCPVSTSLISLSNSLTNNDLNSIGYLFSTVLTILHDTEISYLRRPVKHFIIIIIFLPEVH